MRTTVVVYIASVALGTIPLYPANITIEDRNTSSKVGATTYNETTSGWHRHGTGGPDGEYKEVEPAMIGASEWDLVAFTYDSGSPGGSLSVISSYNLKAGQTHGGVNYPLGHLFIDVNQDSSWYHDPLSPFPSGDLNSTFKYDYGVIFNFNANTYDAYRLSDTTAIINNYYADSGDYNQASNPYRFNPATATKVGSGTLLYQNNFDTALSAAAKLALLGFSVDSTVKHRMTLENLGAWLPGSDAFFHLTMFCGNDNLEGRTQTVPEPGGTLGLLASVFSALLGARIRARRS